jgi:Kelch motif
MRRAGVLLGVCLLCACGGGGGGGSSVPDWYLTGPMSTMRRGHRAALLPDGTVLVAGGSLGATTAEIYDPAAGTFAPTGGLQAARAAGFTATALDDGRVLLVGGTNNPQTAEVYDPMTGMFSVTGPPSFAHVAGVAVKMSSGKVLVAGGTDGLMMPSVQSAAEVWDPTTGQFTTVMPMGAERGDAAGVLLASGLVLVVGGFDVSFVVTKSAEVYDPAMDKWTPVGDMTALRSLAHAIRLPDDRVLVIGGSLSVDTGDLYDPMSATFSATLDSMQVPRSGETAVLLDDGTVLIAGGSEAVGPVVTATADLFDPLTDAFTPTASMNTQREEATMTLLDTGDVLVAGGTDGTTDLATAERYIRP